jgi:hypothetical protein
MVHVDQTNQWRIWLKHEMLGINTTFQNFLDIISIVKISPLFFTVQKGLGNAVIMQKINSSIFFESHLGKDMLRVGADNPKLPTALVHTKWLTPVLPHSRQIQLHPNFDQLLL